MMGDNQIQPIRYIYCLVDSNPSESRFKLGSSLSQHYAEMLSAAYCRDRSFQIGFPDAYARIGEESIHKNYAKFKLESGEMQLGEACWFSLECFSRVRALLCHVDHDIKPTKIQRFKQN